MKMVIAATLVVLGMSAVVLGMFAAGLPGQGDQATATDAADLASWSDVVAGGGRMPAIAIDESIYPDATGVQFFRNGLPLESSTRPKGYDITGPAEGSRYHVHPGIRLATGDSVTALWITSDGSEYMSTATIDLAGVPPATYPVRTDADHGRNLTIQSVGVRHSGYVYDEASDTFRHPDLGALQQSGSIVTSRHGQVIEGVDIRGSITVLHDNVTIHNCRIRYEGELYAIHADKGGVGTIVANCDVEHMGQYNGKWDGNIGILARDTEIHRTNLSGWRNAVRLRDHTHVYDSRVTKAAVFTDGTHASGMSSHGAVDISIVRSYLTGGTSSVVSLYAKSPFTDVRLVDNYLTAGQGEPSYCLYAGMGGGDDASNMTFTGNVFGQDGFPRCGQFGPLSFFDATTPGLTWCDNRMADGSPVGTEVACR